MSKVKKGSKPLPSKDLSNFREAVRLYESSQYRKALKLAEQILKKHPGHGETTAVRGLVRYHLNMKDEARQDMSKCIASDPESGICWHLYGIYQRLEKNYEEAVKAFAKTYQIDPTNINICRDLSVLQVQTRQFKNAIATKGSILENKPGYRQHWNALAIVQYLAKDYAAAENTLSKFENVVNQKFPKTDLENSEITLFKNVIIYESGDVARALEDLEKIADNVSDPLSVMEYRAKYLLELGKKKEAEREYRALIKRNPDCREYLFKLEEALGIAPANTQLRKILYDRLAEKYPKSNAIRAIPLEFLTGAEFKSSVTKYLNNFFQRGVPSAFVNLKPFYKDSEKREIIGEVVEEIYKAELESKSDNLVWVVFYLAQHHSYLRNIESALKYIDKCFELSPDNYAVEFGLVKGKIYKHAGDLVQAADALIAAQETDKSDRFINSKTGKYLLRANKIEEAIEILSLFTRNDSTGTGVNDFHDMQTLYILIELGEAYIRTGDKGLALKRIEGINKVFFEIFTDQFDFHTYCMHKGTARAYVNTLRFSDGVYRHPTFVRAARDAVELYISVYEDNLKKKQDEIEAEKSFNALSEEERKKILKKQKKERVKEFKKENEEKERQRKAAAEKASAASSPEPTSQQPVVDEDPLGRALLQVEDPLDAAYKFWKPLGEQFPDSLDTWDIVFNVYFLQGKYVLALQAIAPRGKSCGASDSWIAQRVARLKYAVSKPATETAVAPAIKLIVERSLPKSYLGIEDVTDLSSFVAEKVLDTSSIKAIFDYVQVILEIDDNGKDLVENVLLDKLLDVPGVDYNDAYRGLVVLKRLDSAKVEEYRNKALTKWPHATVF